jgi:hypothetical protein
MSETKTKLSLGDMVQLAFDRQLAEHISVVLSPPEAPYATVDAFMHPHPEDVPEDAPESDPDDMATLHIRPSVQRYLFDHSLDELARDHHVKARISADGTRVCLAYDRILATFDDPYAPCCRGLILRPALFATLLANGEAPSDAWKSLPLGPSKVVAWGMDRFPNAGERVGGQDDLDWTDPGLQVCEKLDGTLIHVYFDDVADRWTCATRGVPDADVPLDERDAKERFGITFADLFREAVRDTCDRAAIAVLKAGGGPPARPLGTDMSLDALLRTTGLLPACTYAFELTSPYNKVGVTYADKTATLLAARHTDRGVEIPLAEAASHWWLLDDNGSYAALPVAPTWSVNTLEGVRRMLRGLRADACEGVVACDSAFRRVKIKSEAWLFATQLKAGLVTSPRRVIELVVGHQIDDVLPVLDDVAKEQIHRFRGELGEWCAKVDEEMRRLASAAQSGCVVDGGTTPSGGKMLLFDNRRMDSAFAEAVLKSRFPRALLFGMWRTQPWAERVWEKRLEGPCSALAYLEASEREGRFSTGLKDEILQQLPPVQLVPARDPRAA